MLHRIARVAMAAGILVLGGSGADARDVRVVVEVAGQDLGKRAIDQRPARVDFDFPELLKKADLTGRVDFDSLRVIREGGDEQDVIPFRWYDADIPDPLPEVNQAISRTNGVFRRQPGPMAGHFYNVSGRGERGFLAFLHTQRTPSASRYVISFKLVDTNAAPAGNGPRGWLGDGQALCAQRGSTTTGSGHSRIALDDFNGDGLIDIVQGEECGLLFLYPNTGTKREPRFGHRTFLSDAEGSPIDVGVHAAPLVTDFDGDGVKDLLVGTWVNRILFFKNVGTNESRKLISKGFVTRGDKPIETPASPIVGRSEGVFPSDSYAVLDAVDWNGDGRTDLLAGGFITGRIFLLENTGTSADGTPVLAEMKPIEADGKPINVGDWAAAPCAVDLNGDGKLDLLSGRIPMTPESSKDKSMLRYYESTPSGLTQKPLPHQGELPAMTIGTPRHADLNDDGVSDLVVSARQNIYVLFNRGTKTSPKFVTRDNPILLPWASAPMDVQQFLDYDRDGRPDRFTNDYVVHLNTGAPLVPAKFDKQVRLLPPGERIAHPSGVGDDWYHPRLADLDADGDWDVLFGDWHGTIWFHRNTGTDAAPKYDMTGYRLKLAKGDEIKVGPVNKDPNKDFNALQGARTVFAVADVDADGLPDLAVGDCYGAVRFYRNAGPSADPTFEPAIELGSMRTRCSIDFTDWNGDGRPDVIAGSAGTLVSVFLSEKDDAGKMRFAEALDPKLPPIKQPRVLMADLNGDGDEDLFVPSLQGSVWIERSFLNGGYANGRVTKVEVVGDK